MKKRDTEELINIGKIGSSVGLRGEVRVTLYSPDSDNLKEGKVLLLKHTGKTSAGAGANRNGSAQEMKVKCLGVRRQKDKPVIRLEGITDRTMADELRGMEVYITSGQLEKLPKGQHYVRDIIGYRVIDLTDGGEVGVLRDVIQNTAQNILEVERTAGSDGEGTGRTVLIPAVDAFLRRIDDENEVIEVELIPGFLD